MRVRCFIHSFQGFLVTDLDLVSPEDGFPHLQENKDRAELAGSFMAWAFQEKEPPGIFKVHR